MTLYDLNQQVQTDVSLATVGVNAELLVSLSSDEIIARLSASKLKFVVVFDGPGRTTKQKLMNGLTRRRIMKTLLKAKFPFIVAPYLAAAQLAYMFNNGFVTHVAGADECWLWSRAPILLDFFASLADPKNASVLFKQNLLNSLRITDASFVEAVVGFGNNAIISTGMPMGHKSLSDVCRIAFQLGGPPNPQLPSDPQQNPPISVLRALLLSPASSPEYVQQFRNALVFVQRQPVLNSEGTITLNNLSNQPIPQDLVDVLGRQLSPELFYYLNKGILGPEMLQGMLYGKFEDCFEYPQDTEMYRKIEVSVQPLRQQAYSLLASTSHRYFQVKKVDFRYGDFVRTTPEFPTLPAELTPEEIVKAAVKHTRKLAKIDDNVALSNVPEELAVRAGVKNPAPVLVNIVQLALRQMVESCVEWFMASGKVERTNTEQYVLAMPWA